MRFPFSAVHPKTVWVNRFLSVCKEKSLPLFCFLQLPGRNLGSTVMTAAWLPLQEFGGHKYFRVSIVTTTVPWNRQEHILPTHLGLLRVYSASSSSRKASNQMCSIIHKKK